MALVAALLWLGMIYGTLDGLFLTVVPVLATRRALTTPGINSSRLGSLGRAMEGRWCRRSLS